MYASVLTSIDNKCRSGISLNAKLKPLFRPLVHRNDSERNQGKGADVTVSVRTERVQDGSLSILGYQQGQVCPLACWIISNVFQGWRWIWILLQWRNCRVLGGEIRGILDPFVIKILVKYVGENRWCFSHRVHLGMPCFYAETGGHQGLREVQQLLFESCNFSSESGGR